MRHTQPAPRVLLIGGSYNQTTMVHAVGRHLEREFHCSYSPYYAGGILDWAAGKGFLDFTVLGGPMRRQTEQYLARERLPVDYRGSRGPYDLVVSASDLVVQRNVKMSGTPLVLVQEGMTDPENATYRFVRRFGLPRWLASTAATGLSLAYEKFCVASEGYRELFVRKGVPGDRIVVTGIPNFDNCRAFLENDFPYRGFVLAATSDGRETFKRDRRMRFLAQLREIAAGRQIIVKLHPNEIVARATAEVRAAIPNALVFSDGNVNHMIANCDVLVTQWSTCVYVGLALGKECHSYFDLAELRRLMPIQNGGTSARRIAEVCAEILDGARAARGGSDGVAA